MENSFYQDEQQKLIATRDKMNDYLKSTSIRFLGILIIVILITASFLFWFFASSIALGIDALKIAENGRIDLYVPDTELNENHLFNAENFPKIMTIDDQPCTVISISEYPQQVTLEMDPYQRYVGDLEPGNWYYTIKLQGDLPDGISKTHVIYGWASPASLLFEK